MLSDSQCSSWPSRAATLFCVSDVRVGPESGDTMVLAPVFPAPGSLVQGLGDSRSTTTGLCVLVRKLYIWYG